MDSKRVDFEKLRKKRQRVQTGKRLLALAVILALIAGVISLNSFLIDNSVTIRLSDFLESFGGSGYPVPVPGGVIRDVKTIGSDLAVLNDTNLYVYNKNGKIANNVQQMGDSTILATGGDRALTYDVGGKRYSIHSRSKTLLEKENPFHLQGGDINASGIYALVSSSAQYVAQVTVFDTKFEQIFEWRSSDNFVVDISISPKGSRLAAGCFNTRGGVGYSLVMLFDFGYEGELQRMELPGETVYNVQFLDDGRFTVLTDKEYRLFSADGVLETGYGFGGSTLLGIERQDKQTLLNLSPDGSEQELVLLGSDLAIISSHTTESKVRDMALGDREIYLLADTGIKVFGLDFQEKSELELRGILQIHQVKNKLYYFTKEEIAILGG